MNSEITPAMVGIYHPKLSSETDPVGEPAAVIHIVHENKALTEYLMFGSEALVELNIEDWLKGIAVLRAHMRSQEKDRLQTYFFHPALSEKTIVIIDCFGMYNPETLEFTANKIQKGE